MKEEKYGFVYIWFDSKRKMYYIGSHWGNVLDGYICSSNRMRDAYSRRPETFKRRILKTNITAKKELYEEEHRLLQSRQHKKNIYYNIRFSIGIIEKFSFTGKNHSNETKEKLSEIAKNRDLTPYKNRMGVRNKLTGWQGKIDCKDYDKTIHEALVFRTDKKVTVIDENGNSFGVTKEYYQQNKDSLKTHSSIFNKGKKPACDWSVVKGTIPVYTKEGKCIRVKKDDVGLHTGEYVAQASLVHKGRICINNGILNKKIYPENIDEYVGWNRGMIKRK